MTTIDKMRSDLIRASLRRAYREAVNTLMASDISERAAEIAAVDALEKLAMEKRLELMGARAGGAE